jgi:hypothetical protein
MPPRTDKKTPLSGVEPGRGRHCPSTRKKNAFPPLRGDERNFIEYTVDKSSYICSEEMKPGAGNGNRTRDTKLGKLVLYQLSYARPQKMLSEG